MHLRKRALLQIRYIAGQDTESEIEKIENYLFSLHNPREYAGPKGLEVSMKKNFTETCILLSQYVSADPKRMTVVEFYTALETVKKQLKNGNQSNKSQRHIF